MKFDIVQSKSNSKTLRMPHQHEAVESLNKHFNLDKPIGYQSGLVIMPTGSGKTFTAVSWLLNSGIAKGYRVLWLVHRQELINQTYYEFEERLGDLKEYGIKTINMMAVSGNPMHNGMSQLVRQDINICSIHSVASKNGMRFIRRMLGKRGQEKLIVVIDEAHHAVMPSYMKVLRRISNLNPNFILLGLTATPIRMGKYETQKLNRMFSAEEVIDPRSGEKQYKYVYQIDLATLIQTGFLAKPIYKYIETNIVGDIEFELTQEDLEHFNKFADFTEDLKGRIASLHSRNELIINEYIANKEKYGKTLVFALNQDHAEFLNELFRKKGIKSDYAISRRSDSWEVIQNFKKNDFDVLINVQMLTEGTDVPDIQTIFLTRETNSDSLLLQMIGRGLRGVAAKGTENAYIISFHDKWEKLNFWLRPEFAIGNTAPSPQEKGADSEITPVTECPEEIIEIPKIPEGLAIEEMFAKLYQAMRVNLLSETKADIVPDGWYVVIDEVNEQDVSVPVFAEQLLGYQLLEDNFGFHTLSASAIQRELFKDILVKPELADLQLILEHIRSEGEMPEYYTFEERALFEPRKIAERMLEQAKDKDEQYYWLRAYYEQNPILANLYKTFFAFRKTVLDSLVEEQASSIVAIDVREEYKIIPNYYDIEELYNEVITAHPKLAEPFIESIGWSKKVIKSWFAICYQLPLGVTDHVGYSIYVNCLLSSPKVSRESIKYLIYHELLHAYGYWNHDEDFRAEEWKYPNSEELDGELDSLALRYNLDFSELKKTRFEEMGIELPKLNTGEQDPVGEKVDLRTEDLVESETFGTIHFADREYKFCRICGQKLPITANFCDRCGEDVRYSEEE